MRATMPEPQPMPTRVCAVVEAGWARRCHRLDYAAPLSAGCGGWPYLFGTNRCNSVPHSAKALSGCARAGLKCIHFRNSVRRNVPRELFAVHVQLRLLNSLTGCAPGNTARVFGCRLDDAAPAAVRPRDGAQSGERVSQDIQQELL